MLTDVGRWVCMFTFPGMCCLSTVVVFWQLHKAWLFQLPMNVLWSPEKICPEGLLALDGEVCLLVSLSLPRNSSPLPCLLAFLCQFFFSSALRVCFSFSIQPVFSDLTVTLFVSLSGLTQHLLHWCLRTSTFSCLPSCHPTISMAWENMYIKIFSMTPTGRPGPSSPEMVFLMGWGTIYIRYTARHPCKLPFRCLLNICCF